MNKADKMKRITFSYDDGVTQDVRLIELFNKYNLKATFNINSELLGRTGELEVAGIKVNHNKSNPEDIMHIYDGHEVAGHTLTHPLLTAIADDAEIIRQVEQDRLRLSELAGYEVVGFAYPCGGQNNDDRVADIIKNNTGIKYCRTITSSYSFDEQKNMYRFNPTLHHQREWDKMFALAEEFIALDADSTKIFYIWGHSYELDVFNEWDKFEELCKLVSGHKDIFYGTNREVFDI